MAARSWPRRHGDAVAAWRRRGSVLPVFLMLIHSSASGASRVNDVVLPALLKAFQSSSAGDKPRSFDCVEQEAEAALPPAKLTRVSELLRDPPGDKVLALRATLRLLAEMLEPLTRASVSDCLGTEELPNAVSRLATFVQEGKIDDGICPFTGKDQTTIGGTDVLKELGVLKKGGWSENDKKGARAGKALGKLLRKVLHADGNPPPGTVPVNWQMREMMFGAVKVEL